MRVLMSLLIETKGCVILSKLSQIGELHDLIKWMECQELVLRNSGNFDLKKGRNSDLKT